MGRVLLEQAVFLAQGHQVKRGLLTAFSAWRPLRGLFAGEPGFEAFHTVRKIADQLPQLG